MNRPTRRAFTALVLLSGGATFTVAQAPDVDPLPSWRDGAARRAILDFVERVTTPGNTHFVPPPERIATFDNDGTLWSEQPIYFQFAFALDRIKELAPKHPEWKNQQPFEAVLEGDQKALLAGGEPALLKIMAESHTGMTTEEFQDIVKDWIASAHHPRFKRPYTDLTYKPMQELLHHLRSKGFKTFIVSGGGVEFMRAWAEKTYGIPPEQVVGSMGKLKFEMRDGNPVLLRLPEADFIDDKAGKVLGIQKFIGRRPIFAAGNSDGDLEMLQWTTAGTGSRFSMIVRHTDADREWAYDRNSHIGRLDKALDEAGRRGWLVVDMKKDWKTVYSFDH
jgi:phosphoglycolate phosphatase-like HAD superfamily hydrolase